MRTSQVIIIVSVMAALLGLSAYGGDTHATARRAPTNPGTTNLVSWWALDETSGTREDAHGTNDLTDNNTVGYTTGKKSNAADFISSNSESLSIGDNASVSTGDIDFSLCGWMYLNDVDTYSGPLVSKWHTTTTNREFILEYLQVNNRFTFYVSPDGSDASKVLIKADSFGKPSSSVWYFACAWHDAANNTINIQVNNGTVDSSSFSNGVFDSVSTLNIGRVSPSSTLYHNGYIDEVAFYKRVLTADEREYLYNSGNGREYCEVADTCATATPTPSHTLTPSSTPTITETPTITNTPSITPTPTPSSTPAITETQTPSSTPTITETPTPSSTPTITETPTVTPTPTITNTPLPTRTPGNMATAFFDSAISYGETANVTATSLLCLVVILGILAYITITTLQRRKK